jgi:hypothetical protein
VTWQEYETGLEDRLVDLHSLRCPDQLHVAIYLERNCIALLSNFGNEPIDRPSERWLGLHSPQETMRKSGLWNTNYVGDEYAPAFLDVLEKYVREAKPVSSDA